ncbi:M48 family metallopeptidase [Collinsella provencensis]|uniref:M48 family metallopeptidase n=1 Tax=Collinsella provencensis TaxID=1937461 RepID=UPI000C833D3C|nr:SprT family zinc-dependent metalloprotease [Collinsella provencensis]
MPAAFDLAVITPDGASIPVRVTRKRVKNLNLRVTREGDVLLSIPLRCPVSTAERFLNRKAPWIAARVHARNRWTKRQEANELARPTTIALWGENVDAAQVLDLDETSLQALSAEEFNERLNHLYKAEVKRALPPVNERLEAVMGVHATRWSVRSMKTRWGSCTPKTGAIRIASGLAAYPPECLEFVVAHELVHLLEPSHNARFHSLLDQFCPENRERAAQLKKQPNSQ